MISTLEISIYRKFQIRICILSDHTSLYRDFSFELLSNPRNVLSLSAAVISTRSAREVKPDLNPIPANLDALLMRIYCHSFFASDAGVPPLKKGSSYTNTRKCEALLFCKKIKEIGFCIFEKIVDFELENVRTSSAKYLLFRRYLPRIVRLLAN